MDCVLRLPFLFTDSDGPCSVGIVYPVHSVSLTVEQSMSLVLECVVSGNPTPVVKWLKDGQELSHAPRLRLLHSNLALSNVQISDRGNYTCFLQVEEGAVASANYTVDVLGKFSHVDVELKSYSIFKSNQKSETFNMWLL